MKNKFLIYFVSLFFAFMSFVHSDEIEITSEIIKVENNGNTLIGENNVVIKTINNSTIYSDNVVFEKNKNYIKATGNIKIENEEKDIIIFSQFIEYYGNEEKIISKGLTKTKVKNKYFIKSKNITYNIKKKAIYSKDKAEIDFQGKNFINIENFTYEIDNDLVKGEKLKYFDTYNNSYFVERGIYNLGKRILLGKDVKGYLDSGAFGNKQNEPRFSGRKIYADDNKTKINKGVFTTCKKRDGCPPWTIKADEVMHDKVKKIINYKNSWLTLYDVPVLYFPKFFHPDPTVKRQSGFLAPRFVTSNTFGSSIYLPYFHVLSENKDITFKPKLYEGKNFILQNEYREVRKNSDHIFDVSFGKSDINQVNNNSETKSHFFSNSRINLGISGFDTSDLKIQLQKASDESYLKAYKIQSPLIDFNSTLNNTIEFVGTRETSNFNLKTIVYEDTTKTSSSDKYEYIYPSYFYSKYFEDNPLGLNLNFQSSGFQRKYNTNTYEGKIINNFSINKDLYSNYGFKNEFSTIFKNVNIQKEENSNESEKIQLLTEGLLKTSLPMRKEDEKYKKFFIPTISLRYSPNKTANIVNEDKVVDVDNIFSLNRVGTDEIVEGGQSLTLGSEYKLFDKNDRELFNINLATMLRDTYNGDLPTKSTLNQKTSDLFGETKINFTDNFSLNYKFALDNNYDALNYNFVETQFSVNNFITTFDFLEESKDRGGANYISNKTEYKFDDANSLAFSTRKNKLKNLTEFYDLIYQYKSDCLTASLQYKKEYYSDEDLKPNESLFFNITIVPFQTFQTKNFKD